MLKVYTCNSFSGHWPVGSAAVVIAESDEEAAKMLEERLSEIGLKQDIDESQMIQASTEKQVIILCDGDY